MWRNKGTSKEQRLLITYKPVLPLAIIALLTGGGGPGFEPHGQCSVTLQYLILAAMRFNVIYSFIVWEKTEKSKLDWKLVSWFSEIRFIQTKTESLNLI